MHLLAFERTDVDAVGRNVLTRSCVAGGGERRRTAGIGTEAIPTRRHERWRHPRGTWRWTWKEQTHVRMKLGRRKRGNRLTWVPSAVRHEWITQVRRRRYFENTQDIKKRKDKELRKRRGRKPFKPQQSMASAMSSGRFSDTMPPAGLSAPFAELFTPDAEEEEGSDAK